MTWAKGVTGGEEGIWACGGGNNGILEKIT
jgi:hypothetical protein